ncbi:hypothetical protein [Mycetocola zhadangensis]|uniref:Pilus assembly protein PilO n=1 Tax=Mycetocola zhadangensis TaxID=1164595 RepID=A0A3L7J4I2_9MICO|nr:hypothetical protein [Mycetocola zhadangensis]RLQ85359.1 hypothetical protein D9V28_00225 [Mycetocola zhadangensis]GGE81935.1 hypothetical protein GCM10011313_00440 [Mycetocola zhadangensis]
MDKTKIWVLGSAIVMIGVLALGWFTGIDPLLQAKATTDEQRVAVEAQNQATEVVIAKLKKDFESIDELKVELAGLRSSIPADGQLPGFLSQLDSLAAGSATKVTDLTVSEAIPYTAPATSVVVVEEPVEGDAEAASTEGEADEAVEAPEAPAAPLAPPTITDPRITSENFVAIPVDVTVEGDRAGARAFIDGLQHGTRLFMATSITMKPMDDKPGQYTTQVAGYVYTLLN